MDRRIPTAAGATALVLAFLAAGAGAQDPEPPPPPVPAGAAPEAAQEEPERLDTVIVTATRSVQEAFALPYQVRSRPASESAGSRLFQDSLRSEPGITVQRTSYGQASPFLRGLTGYHTLLLVDGIRFNSSAWRAGLDEYWGLVDSLATGRTEIVYGPGTVLYGSDAVGGVVNALPLRRMPEGESSWERRVFVRYSGAENSITGRVQVAGNVGDDLGFVLGATAGSFGDLKAGGGVGRQPHTGYSSKAADFRFDIPLDAHWSLGLTGREARLDHVGRVHRTIHAVPWHGTQVGSDRRMNMDYEWQFLGAVLEGSDLDGFANSAAVRLSLQRLEETSDRIRGSGAREKEGFDVVTGGLSLHLSSPTPIGRLDYGIDAYHDDVDSFSRTFAANGNPAGSGIQGGIGDDARYELFGAFLQDTIPLGDAFDAILGGRFTWAEVDADRVEDPSAPGTAFAAGDSWTSLDGSARLLWKPAEELRLFAGAAQAFHAPNVNDLTRAGTVLSGEVEIPAGRLDPEDFLCFEAGVKTAFDRIEAGVTYWYTILDGLIIRQPTGAMSGGSLVVVKTNGGDGHVQGVDLGVRWEFADQWEVRAGFAWTDGQIEGFPTSAPVSRTEPLTRLQPVQALVSVRWETADGVFWVRPSVRLVDRQDRLSSSDRRDTQRIPPGGSPGYTIWSLDAGVRLGEGSSAFLSVENLGDKNYRVHGSGVQEPGLNIVVGVDVTF